MSSSALPALPSGQPDLLSDREFPKHKAARRAPSWEPRSVFLFSGHMIDAPGRPTLRFPPEAEPIAARAIAEKLDELGAGEADLAICGGACGGDILFAEACVARGLLLQIHIQFREPEFLKASVSFAGEQWTRRFLRLKSHPRTRVLVLPDELGPLPDGTNPYVRNNLWQLDAALGHGPEKVRLLALWDGGGGDGPGGTAHMVETVRTRSGTAHVLRTQDLW